MAELQTPWLRTHDWRLVTIGLAGSAAGVYFAVVGLGELPPPSRINGPIWLSLLIGLIIFAGSVAVVVRGITGGGDSNGDLPENAPRWAKIVYWLTGVACAAGLAGLGTWVAFGAGTRHFSMAGFISGTVGETIGRTVFGIGALITWLLVVALARNGAKKIFGKTTQ